MEGVAGLCEETRRNVTSPLLHVRARHPRPRILLRALCRGSARTRKPRCVPPSCPADSPPPPPYASCPPPLPSHLRLQTLSRLLALHSPFSPQSPRTSALRSRRPFNSQRRHIPPNSRLRSQLSAKPDAPSARIPPPLQPPPPFPSALTAPPDHKVTPKRVKVSLTHSAPPTPHLHGTASNKRNNKLLSRTNPSPKTIGSSSCRGEQTERPIGQAIQNADWLR